MSVAEIYEKRATFSFEVFPPKTDVGMEKLCGKDGVLEKLYTLNPDYISCTYGAGGTNVGKNLEVLDKIVKDGNEFKCYFCIRTFYGSDFPYSTPETADTYSSTFANELVKAKFVNVEDGVILGDVAYYWTTDKDNDNKTDDTNKVPSAKTFDAGVAMYVGMSLLSVAGGAVVIGKKKEF